MIAIQYENNPWEEDWWKVKTSHPNPRRCVALTRGLSQIPLQKHSYTEAAYSHLDCMVPHTDPPLGMGLRYVLIEDMEFLNGPSIQQDLEQLDLEIRKALQWA